MARGGKIGWFLGLIFGTLFGVLFAPRKGKELRAKIKADRRKGGLGVAPLKDDLTHLGKQLADLAKEVYESDTVQEIVATGRKKVKELSKDLVGEVHDFHATRIEPFEDEARIQMYRGKQKIAAGQRALRKAKKKWGQIEKKVQAGAKIGKRAVREIKHVMKKKDGA